LKLINNKSKMMKKKMHVMILGDGAVGKTSILKQYAN
jgi:GTPase SAR1 family protein